MKTVLAIVAFYTVSFVCMVGVLVAVDATIGALERHQNKKKAAEVVA
jgi:hypothetical protein